MMRQSKSNTSYAVPLVAPFGLHIPDYLVFCALIVGLVMLVVRTENAQPSLIGLDLLGIGLVLGILALVQIRKRGERGKGMAVAGIVLSTVGALLRDGDAVSGTDGLPLQQCADRPSLSASSASHRRADARSRLVSAPRRRMKSCRRTGPRAGSKPVGSRPEGA